MKQIWLFVAAGLFVLTVPVMGFAGQAMSTGPVASGKAMETAKDGEMGMPTKDKKMEGKGMQTEEKKGTMGMQEQEKKTEGAGAKAEGKK